MSYDVIEEINSILNPAELKMFKESCFGYLLDIPKIKVQNQIIHCLLLREVHQPNKTEMWFEVGGHRLKFGIEEFALISGLKCIGDSNKYGYPQVSNGLIDTYFSGCKSVSKQTLHDLFKSRRWESDEDGFKIAFMHFLHNFLLASPMTTRIQLKDFDVVDSADFNDYPWGIDVFKYTFDSLTTKAVLSPGSLKKSKSENEIYKYRLIGFPQVLLCWFYECCPTVKNSFVQLVNKTAIPRILRWQAFFFPYYIPVDREIFLDVASDKVTFRSIVPTPAERNALYLGDFFKRNKGKGKASDDVSVGKEDGCEVGYRPAFDISRDRDPSSKLIDLSIIEEKLEFLVAGQKTMQSDISKLKQFFNSKVSEVLKVVTLLNVKLNPTVDSKQADGVVDSEKDVSSSRDENENDDASPFLGDKTVQSEEPMDSEDTVSDESEPILKVSSKKQEASASMQTSSVVKEENCALPVEESSKNDSFTASVAQSNRGGEDSVARQNVFSDKEIDNKSISSNENNDKEFCGEEEKSKKTEDVYSVDDKAVNDVKVDDVDRVFVADYEAAGCSKNVGSAVGINVLSDFATEKNMDSAVVVSPVTEVPDQRNAILTSPTFNLSVEDIDEVLEKAAEAHAKLKLRQVDYVQANFGCIVPKQSIGCVRICPFHENGNFFCDLKKREPFRKWLEEGRPKKSRKKIYEDSHAILCPRFRFGVVDIELKSWFYQLYHSGQPISCSHVDILLYYLRKKVKLGHAATTRCTTTDTFFDRRIQAIYNLYSKSKDLSLISSKSSEADYINGGRICCNTKWADVDDVLFPINCGKDWHWILARLNFKERCIYVYNSLRSARRDKSANEYVECYSVLLPLYFDAVNLFDSRNDIDTTTGPYEEKSSTDPFRIVNVENIPVQTDIDCGVHMFCAAEFFVDGKVMSDDFDIKEHRARYACSLYTYGCWKDEFAALSEDEGPVKINRI
ncbi:uncharacterized protein LOC126660405 [Mercurialis annua]|uniref:uncharacterized protein LOC126660405 n=1 Tax=Mercurialis annua TaxID=3986 RepID=UPI0024AEF632|nr:uncharacterized protein LOC126660405 [Mercurialis annua]